MNDISNFLQKVPFCSTLSAQETDFLSNYLSVEHYHGGKTILNQGGRSDHLYFLKKGVVSVAVKLPGDTSKEVRKLHEGQVFGEVSFLTNALMTADIIAETNCECVVFYRHVLEMLRVAFPEMAFRFERMIALQSIEKIIENFVKIDAVLMSIPKKLQHHSEHARYLPNPKARIKKMPIQDLDSNFIASMRVFKLLNPNETTVLLSSMVARMVERGYQLSTDTSDTKKLMWIYSGAAMLFFKDRRRLKQSIAVTKVGELVIQNFLFNDFEKIAGYVTCEPSVIIELDAEKYEALKEKHPNIYYAISQNLHYAIVSSLYIVNREFVRINCEYKALLLK